MQWLASPHPGKPSISNRERGQTDLLNYQRALKCFALGTSGGVDNLELIPASAMDVREMLLGRQVERGLELLCAKTGKALPSEKTVKNLIACCRGLQVVALGGKPAALAGKSLTHRNHTRPKRKVRAHFPRKAWPYNLEAEWTSYTEWKTKPILTPSEGAKYRKKVCRAISMDAQEERVNGYVGWFIRERKQTELTLVNLCQLENYSAYLNWFLEQDANCGYANAKMTGTTLATLSQYLVAVGRIEESLPDGRKVWDAFYELSREPMKIGAERGELGGDRDIGEWKPWDLRELGLEGWRTEPVRRQRGNEGRWQNQRMCRRRSALFFILAYETPLRARNFLEMRWGKNLTQLPDGRWRVTFRGQELKVSRRGYATNVYERTYSAAASRIIDAWRADLQSHFGGDFETIIPFVFGGLMHRKRDPSPLRHAAFATHVKALCEELRGEPFNLHKVRHIVASYLVNEHGPGGLGLAAELLGDTPKVVLDSYYKPSNEEAMQTYLQKVSG